MPLTGRWRITHMDLWDPDAIDLVGPGFIEFDENGTGAFGFIAVRGRLDCRPGQRDGLRGVEFSWEGDDEGDAVSGRGWVILAEDGSLDGHLFFHMGDDSGFRAVPAERQPTSPAGTSPADRTRQATERLEGEIEAALNPGRFVSEAASFTFVNDLGEIKDEVATLVAAAPAEAVAVYESFLAGCYEKAEEIDDSGGSFGMFVTDLVCGWITARQAADADPGATAARLLGWMDDDPYGFCYQLHEDAATVLDESGLAAFTERVRARLDTTEPVSGERPHDDYTRRRWAGVLRTLYAAQGCVEDYVALAQKTGLTADDCQTLATMLAARGQPEHALSWVERGLEFDVSAPHGSSAGHSLTELKPRLLTQLGREHEAQQAAWAEYRQHPSSYSYDQLMTFVPESEHRRWHQHAVETAIHAPSLPSVIALLLHTNETEHLAELVCRSADTELEALSHHTAEPAATALESTYPNAAARVWSAQGMRILAGKKSKYYDAALRDFERAKYCYETAGSHEQWHQLADHVRNQHHRKYSFMPGFEQVMAGSGPSKQPTFLEQAKSRWPMRDHNT